MKKTMLVFSACLLVMFGVLSLVSTHKEHVEPGIETIKAKDGETRDLEKDDEPIFYI